MDATLMLWLFGGAVTLLVMMLISVVMARHMDKGRPAAKTILSPSLAKTLGVSTHAKALGASTHVADEAADKTKKQTQAIVGIFTSLAFVGGFIGVVTGLRNGDIEPAISEITAGELRGTLVNVRNSDPVVLIVPGSGSTDRDGNSAPGLSTNAYKLLAEKLAEEGIASVRIDKRGLYGSSSAGNPNDVSPKAYAADIRTWIDTIKAERGAGSGCVFLLGHSEGALMASLAAEGREDVCGLILVAGMGRKMGDVIRQQLRDNPANAPVLDVALGALSQLEAGRHVDTTNMPPALMPLFAPALQSYLIEMLKIDPVEAVRRADKQTLIVQGKADLQISVEDARLLNNAPKTKLQLIDGMNHVLKKAPADRAANLATYTDPSLPLARRLVSRIEDFVKDHD